MSGQAISYHKSSITFSKNTKETIKQDINNLFNMNQVEDYEKYIGLLSIIGRNKVKVFNYIENKIRYRIRGWSKRFL